MPPTVPTSGEKQPDGLGKAVAGGAAWSSLGRIGTQVIQFAASLVLARLLAPSDFGLLASVLVFTQFSVLFFELGMGAALVQMKDPTEEDLSTVFWLNALGGVVFAVLLTAAAPLIADFFGEPMLTKLTPLVALSFTANLGVCHLSLLQRRMNFRSIAASEVLASIVGAVASIVAALLGAGVYALAVGPIVQRIVASVTVWLMVPWRPHRFIVRSSLPTIWAFSGGALGFNVVNYWGRNADNLLVGRFAGAGTLGLYNRAYNFMLLPVQQVSQVLGRVMFPALSRMRDDHVRAALAYRRALKLINAVAVPMLAGIALVSPALVPFLWGDAWIPMVPLLAILCVAGIPQCMTTSVGWVYQSQGRTGAMFKMGLLTSSLGVIAMAVGVHWGAQGVAWAVVLRSWLFALPTLHVACSFIDLSSLRVLKDNLGTFLLTTLMAAVVWFLPWLLHTSRDSSGTLGLQVVAGGAVYAVGFLAFQRSLIGEVRKLTGKS